jgi:hypothetical protein
MSRRPSWFCQHAVRALDRAPENVAPRAFDDRAVAGGAQQAAKSLLVLRELQLQHPAHHLQPDLVPIRSGVVLAAAALLRHHLCHHAVALDEDVELPVGPVREPARLVERFR